MATYPATPQFRPRPILQAITRCGDLASRTNSLPNGRAVFTACCFAVAVALGCRQVNIRLTIGEMRMQQRRLQEQRISLLQEERQLLHVNETLCATGNLAVAAHRQVSGMVQTRGAERMVVGIPRNLCDRYAADPREIAASLQAVTGTSVAGARATMAAELLFNFIGGPANANAAEVIPPILPGPMHPVGNSPVSGVVPDSQP